ncbi:MAG: PQQ-binding-like beta-propeller repeat protein [Actinomycetota bacterium]
MNSSDASTKQRRTRNRVLGGLAVVIAAGGAVAGMALGGSSGQTQAAVFPDGTPPEVTADSSAFSAPNATYNNDRAATASKINAGNVSTLKEAWRFKLSGKSAFGVFSSNPIVTKSAVYLQDINSNVFKVDRATGKLIWKRTFNEATTGPNGVALGYGLVLGGTHDEAFALDDDTGAVVWRKKVTRQPSEGVDIQPLVWGDQVIVSTVPGASLANFYGGGGKGIIYSLDARTGATRWSFDTTTDNLWGNAKVNSGGGAWNTPSVDKDGNVYIAVANPAPWPGVPKFPNGSSRPGKNLYTNSLVVLDGKTGKLKWYWQALAHDLRDWDLHLPPILTTFTINGKETEVVVLGGKMGTVYVVDRNTHKLIWKRDVGIHTDEDGPNRNAPFKKFPTRVYPGWLGGVETPMAVADGKIFVPVVNLCAIYDRQDNFTKGSRLCDFKTASGEIIALDGATGKVVWQKRLKQQNYGGATVVNDLVLTVWFDGMIRAHNVDTGALVWEKQAPAYANASPAVAEDLLVVGAGYPALKGQTPSVVAYRLP